MDSAPSIACLLWSGFVTRRLLSKAIDELGDLFGRQDSLQLIGNLSD
jgi:hypothetical protein